MSQLDAVGVTLLRAASDVLANHGPAALTVRRIATEAGVSTMNVYSRFGGKDGVIDHLFTEGFRRLAEAVEAEPPSDDPFDDLRTCGERYRQFALEHPTYYSVMFDRVMSDYQPSPAALQQAGATLQLLADRLARAMDLGALVPADPLATAASVWATCHGVVSLELRGVGPDAIDWAAVYRTTTASLLRGLAVGARPSL
jgi:AcrR family transcriptional regulator